MQAHEAEWLVSDLAVQSRDARALLDREDTAPKDAALRGMAAAIRAARDDLLAANTADLEAARGRATDPARLDRLALDEERIAGMAQALETVADLPDPVGAVKALTPRPSGITVGRIRVPLGTIGVVYEARPNVTAEAGALCLKSGNAVLLRGGSDAHRTNKLLGEHFRACLREAGLPADLIQILPPGRELVPAMAAAAGELDLLIPRGGPNLIRQVADRARVPVLKHLEGNCHVYVDAHADADMAEDIVLDAKTGRLGTCNTAESLLVHSERAGELVPRLARALAGRGIELRGCLRTEALAAGIAPAREEDFDTEYLAPIASMKVVDHLDAAVEHIHRHGSGHSDAIVTEHLGNARRFLREVDSSSVLVNASTRFADGGEYGLGAEIGISTDRLHARGPVGLEGLTTRKWIVQGEGQLRTGGDIAPGTALLR